mmetsp:Transcript_49972/g.160628  ORF Transcript_49972/g.160628 Transcript_49972/m.160628 type:complete len:155 (+) Transcript_49972:260-724(+)
MEEYKQRYGGKGEKTELGHLGADLDDDALLMKKAVQEKMKQFSKELQRINRHRSDVNKVQPKPPAPKPASKATARDKALEFAKNVPKPKVEVRQALQIECKSPSAAAADARKRMNGADQEEQDDLAEIRRREKQHFEDVAKVAQIREFLALIAV